MSTDIANPTEDYNMSPEMVEVVTSYLETSDVSQTAHALAIPREKVAYYLNKPEAKRFLDTIFLEQGYLNRPKMMSILDEIVEQKLLEMEEAEMTSSKDIIDILSFIWKIRQDTVKETQTAAPTKQVTNNTQINGGVNYNTLMSRLNNKEASN